MFAQVVRMFVVIVTIFAGESTEKFKNVSIYFIMLQFAGCHTKSFLFIHITIIRWLRRVMYNTYISASISSPCQIQASIHAFIIT